MDKLSNLSATGSWLAAGVGSTIQAASGRLWRTVPENTTELPQEYIDLEARVDMLCQAHSSMLKYGFRRTKAFENEPYDYSAQVRESVTGVSASISQGVMNITAAANIFRTNSPATSSAAPHPVQPKSLPHALSRAATAAATAMQGAEGGTEEHLWKALSVYAQVWGNIATARLQQDAFVQKQSTEPWQSALSTSISLAMKTREAVHNSRVNLDVAKSALKVADAAKQEQAQLEVTNAEVEFAQRIKEAIAVMNIVLDNPEPIKSLNELAKVQRLYFASAAESLASVQIKLEEISISAEKDYRTLLLSDPRSQATISPHNQRLLVSRKYPTEGDLDQVIQRSVQAQKDWRRFPLQDRIAISEKLLEELHTLTDEITMELTLQNGRPISQAPGEIRNFFSRGEYLLSIAGSDLADKSVEDSEQPGFRRLTKRDPIGVVFVASPWTFPYLTSIDAIIPAIVAGNAVLLKPSSQTPLTAERFAQALARAGAPKDILQVVNLTPSLTTHVARHPRVDFVSFTGSSVEGQAEERAALDFDGFKGIVHELDGKNPAYVRADADIRYAVAELVEASMSNSGQHSSSVERIYVHESVYDTFVAHFVDLVKAYKLGDPTVPETTLGPVVSIASAQKIRDQVAEAVQAGAKALIPDDLFPIANEHNAYVVPQVLVDVDHSMAVMKAVTFGPVVGIQKVASDDEAIRLMNDTCFSFTASVWTNTETNPDSESAFRRITNEANTGAVFLNRCDRLDPWTNISGMGQGTAQGYDQFTRTTSVNIKI
ncbi:ALDH-like protein [Leucogyrophana mollusca]|uniref:ALDH-like protein n=1 Tax=Leucogyrophana mollusca TaxID=85980 RepID=A0ACB8BD07_9AGAM|nr:ALDH-like protein [Leucogyrophana mollusca]